MMSVIFCLFDLFRGRNGLAYLPTDQIVASYFVDVQWITALTEFFSCLPKLLL